MKRLPKSLLMGAACAVVVTIAWLALAPRKPTSSSPSAVAEHADSAPAEPPADVAPPATTEPEDPPPAPEAAAAEVAVDNNVEVAATRRMYMAHAPLRVPEVADPDSEANRRILETMVLKALRQASPPAASSR